MLLVNCSGDLGIIIDLISHERIHFYLTTTQVEIVNIYNIIYIYNIKLYLQIFVSLEHLSQQHDPPLFSTFSPEWSAHNRQNIKIGII